MDAGDDTATDASMIEASDNSIMSQSSESDCEIWVSVNYSVQYMERMEVVWESRTIRQPAVFLEGG